MMMRAFRTSGTTHTDGGRGRLARVAAAGLTVVALTCGCASAAAAPSPSGENAGGQSSLGRQDP